MAAGCACRRRRTRRQSDRGDCEFHHLLDDKDNQFDKFEVNAETKVTRNGKSARLSDVQAGDRCRVTASLSDKRLLAKSIEATAPQ
jgi:hypothetical protein